MNYKKFKEKMLKGGHRVYKNGKYLTILPNNNAIEYAKGFQNVWEIIPYEYQDFLKFLGMDHYNTWIYSAKFKIC